MFRHEVEIFAYTIILMQLSETGCATLNHRLVEQCVETLCRKGCRAVWACIDTLEAGRSLPEMRGLSDTEVGAVLRELRSVMAVYEGSCVPG